MEQKTSLSSNQPIYSAFQLYLSKWYVASDWLVWTQFKRFPLRFYYLEEVDAPYMSAAFSWKRLNLALSETNQ